MTHPRCSKVLIAYKVQDVWPYKASNGVHTLVGVLGFTYSEAIRLAVRTLALQARNGGSIPPSRTNIVPRLGDYVIIPPWLDGSPMKHIRIQRNF